MGYRQVKGRKPFERASKIAHAELIANPTVQEFIQTCSLPTTPAAATLKSRLVQLPTATDRLTAVIAVDGGLNESFIREEFPSAAIAFMTFGPVFFNLSELDDLDQRVFLGPDDMARLKNLTRYNLVLPTRLVRPKGAKTFASGVRSSIHQFLLDSELAGALEWLLYRGWRPPADREPWTIPRCPSGSCSGGPISFTDGDPVEKTCTACGEVVYLADALRIYERVEEEQGAGGVVSYVLTALEQLALVHVIRAIWKMKPGLLHEVLLVKDGPLAFFGTTAPLHAPMRNLMEFLGEKDSTPMINLVGLEKSGPFVEHAVQIEGSLRPHDCLVLGNDYIYTYITPGDPTVQDFGRNTYYGAKVLFKGVANDMYVATIPTGEYVAEPSLSDLYNGAEVLRATSRLRCSMYDNALIPIALANRLVSLADMPSGEILKKFAQTRMGAISS
jgi:hypothetical protein